jgi:hypothetical protein
VIALVIERTMPRAEHALAYGHEFLGDQHEQPIVNRNRRIEPIGKFAAGGFLQRRHHDGIQAAREQITLQDDQKRLPFPTAGERIGVDVELTHGR